ncbi:MAG: valine--tRNA ligase [Ignavibacteriaceae bacterium]
MSEIPKAYNPGSIEDKWYSVWVENKIFHSEVDKTKEPFTIVIPPPNITGSLTMGHILNNALQDILIRMKRMQGYNACWVPGTDHASIATETKVMKHLKESGIDKHIIGREEFLKHCHEWKDKYGGIIIQQLKKLGVSCDWDRERFTLDDDYYREVIKAFVDLFNEGKIYKGYRLVNWDPASKSAISDEEVIYKSSNGKLWYMRYPLKDSDKYLVVATTRPETMLGDTAVAVNPHDERYKAFMGMQVILPLTNREIPVIADHYVDKEFGTGVVKVTPAHDFNDYEMGQRHNLEMINIFKPDAVTNENVPEKYRNLDRYEARKRVVADLEAAGLMEKTDDYQNNVGYSERGGVPIEPYLSEQWFMKMGDLAKPALEVVLNGEIKFHPAHWSKTYEHWMGNIRDWCISRQLWWGHRIPVWYCGDKTTEECKNPIVSVDAPGKCPHCGSKNVVQDEDVLDTWASSWLWAHGVFRTEEERKYYHPTSVLITAPDIIFFWVARMIMAGLHFEKSIPFKDVYFTSIIRDTQGRKMSKSLGNSPDPLKVIEDYGADALRFTVVYLAPLGQDVLFSEDKCEIGRNFANKIWNAGRFLLMNAQTIKRDEAVKDLHYDFVDKWIESRFNSSLKQFLYGMEKFEINNSIKIVYSLVWNDFCDWYIELIKNRLYSGEEEVKSAVLTRAINLFERLLKLVHPFMPFITEELWHLAGDRKTDESISTSLFPEVNQNLIDETAEEEMQFIMDVITAIRNIRGEMNIPPSKQLDIRLKTHKAIEQRIDYVKKLVKANSVECGSELEKYPASASAVIKDCEIFISLEGLIDYDLERERIQKEIEKIENSLTAVSKKLSNESFVKNAPADIVEKERQKKRDWELKLTKLKQSLAELGN